MYISPFYSPCLKILFNKNFKTGGDLAHLKILPHGFVWRKYTKIRLSHKFFFCSIDVFDFFKNIYPYLENKTELNLPENQAMVRCYIIQFLAKLNMLFKNEAKSFYNTNENKAVVKIKNYINKNFINGISLDKLAEHMYMNKYYMCHMFKEETGLTIKEFVNTRRIAMAKQLLPKYKSVKDLYSACGFNDYSAFYKTFKRFTGVSPMEFLK